MKPILGLIVALCFGMNGADAPAAMLINFEAPPYNTGPVIGQDNWTVGFTSGSQAGASLGVVSSSPVSGAQSLRIQNPNTTGFTQARRDFQPAEKQAGFGLNTPNGTTASFSYLQRIDTYSAGSTGRAGIVFFSQASPNFSSPTYLVFHKDGSIEFNLDSAAGSFTPNNDVYRLTFNFTFGAGFTNNGQVTAFVQDVTTAGPVVSLGTKNFVGSAVNLSTGFLGFGLFGDLGNTATFDQISTVIPEPTSIGLLLLGAALPLRRRRRFA